MGSVSDEGFKVGFQERVTLSCEVTVSNLVKSFSKTSFKVGFRVVFQTRINA